MAKTAAAKILETPTREGSAEPAQAPVAQLKLRVIEGGVGKGTEKTGKTIPPAVMDTAGMVHRIDVFLTQVEGFNFTAANDTVTQLIADEKKREEGMTEFRVDTVAFEVHAKQEMRDAKKARHREEKFLALTKKRVVSVDELLQLVEHYGADNNEFLDQLLSSKKIQHKNKSYRVLRYRHAAGHSFIKIEGFEHVQFLENEANRGWLSLTKKEIVDVLEKQEMKAVKKIEAGITQSPQELAGFIASLRDRKVLPELIRKELMEKKPPVQVEGVTARANYYLEKAGEPLIHFEGYPKNLWATLEPESIRTAVLLSSRLAVINSELGRTKPYDITSAEHIVAMKTSKGQTIDEQLIDQIPVFTQGAITQTDAELLKRAHRLLKLA